MRVKVIVRDKLSNEVLGETHKDDFIEKDTTKDFGDFKVKVGNLNQIKELNCGREPHISDIDFIIVQEHIDEGKICPRCKGKGKVICEMCRGRRLKI
jgi:hypothetical protein